MTTLKKKKLTKHDMIFGSIGAVIAALIIFMNVYDYHAGYTWATKSKCMAYMMYPDALQNMIEAKSSYAMSLGVVHALQDICYK